MSCERVYYIADKPEIAWRDGIVELDPNEKAMIVNQSDKEGFLTVDTGLQAHDFFVCIRFEPIVDDDSITSESYLVGRVDDDGSGTIVHSKLVESYPESYAKGRITEQWQYLKRIDRNIFQVFDLNGLASYLRLQWAQREQ